MKKAAPALLLLLALSACNFSTLMQAPAPATENPAVSTPSLDASTATLVLTTAVIPAETNLPPAPTGIPLTATVTPTSTPVLVDAAEFVADMTIPDGTHVKPGETFVKTWRLRNSGTTTWTRDYALVFANGSQMDGLALTLLAKLVSPGEEIDVSVSLTAPRIPGTYKGYWRLRSASGILFGVGPKAEKPFSVNIKVN
jgi:hypothetical protein